MIDETQILRIDHFLGKEPVMDITYLRFANSILEPVWNRNYVDSRADHDGRGLRRRGPRPFYDPVGTLRDVVQNHLLQVLALVAMEPPSAGPSADAIRDRKADLFQGDAGGRSRLATSAGSTTAISTSPASPRTRRPRPTSRSSSRSTTGAGRACRSSSAPASRYPSR